MTDIKDIQISDYDYPLPNQRIARYPVEPRDHSKLLHYSHGDISSHHFYDLPDLLARNELLIYNNTKVIQARMHFHKSTGAQIEIFCLEPYMPSDYALVFQSTEGCIWKCMIGNSRRWKDGTLTQTLSIGNDLLEFRATRIGADNTDTAADTDAMTHLVRFEWDDRNISFGQILDHFGQLPIPPYLGRDTEEADKTTYQTVYSKEDGSVAAPTAGLHFTRDVLRQLALRGITEDEVTLHVGAGTFKPVKSETIGDHPMHREAIEVSRHTIDLILKHQGNIVAVGTTSVRTLESLYYLGLHIIENPTTPQLTVEQWEPYERYADCATSLQQSLQAIINYLDTNHLPSLIAATRIIIVPGFIFKIVNKLITNFHQPHSTLLLLVSAFVGGNHWRDIYRYALDNDFRFLSYGDSSLLEK